MDNNQDRQKKKIKITLLLVILFSTAVVLVIVKQINRNGGITVSLSRSFGLKILEPDLIPPMVRITAPLSNSRHGQWIGISIEATDDSEIEKVEIYIDGKLKATLLQAPYNWTWDNF